MKKKKKLIIISVVAIGVSSGLAALFGTTGPHGRASTDQAPETDPNTTAAGADQRKQPLLYGLGKWVTRYDPERASGGYNLVLLWRRIPAILDMNGRVIHTWPEARAVGRARLTEEGDLIYLDVNKKITEVDWEGNVKRSFSCKNEDFPHHDLIRLRNGNTLIICRDSAAATDYLLELTGKNEVAHEWRPDEYLTKIDVSSGPSGDVTHFNSVQELPPNQWHDRGDQRFRPGNILVSARHLNTVFIVDRASGEVVWQYREGLDFQHEALMIEKGKPHAGNVLIFNNGARSIYRPKQSSVLEIEPTTLETVWEYVAKYFYSSSAGIEQALPNGNIQITSSRGGRVFEVDREGNIVWQMEPPYLPMRPHRYPYGHCPQLGEPPRPEPVSGPTHQYVSFELYYSFKGGRDQAIEIDGKRLMALPVPSPDAGGEGECRKVVLPFEARLVQQFGFDRKMLVQHGIGPIDVEFTVVLERPGEVEKTTLMQQVVRSTGPTLWHRNEIRLDTHGGQAGALCFRTRPVGGPVDGWVPGMARWARPVIIPPRPYEFDMERRLLTPKQSAPAEGSLMEQQLRALGYAE